MSVDHSNTDELHPQVIDFDRKRNSNREALSHIKKTDEKKLWTFFGDMFIKLPTDKTKELIQKGYCSHK